jgi:site-specific recombinase XerD
VGRAAIQWLGRYLAESRLRLRPTTEAFFVTFRGRPFARIGVSQVLQKGSRGLPARVRVTAHALRRAAAAHCQAAGMNLREIQEYLGHVKIDTTVRYTGLDRVEVAGTVDRYHPRRRMCLPLPDFSSTRPSSSDSIARSP